MKYRISTLLTAFAALFAASAPAATDFTWTGTPLTASSTSIRTDGTLKYAYARFDSTANGVVFDGVGINIVKNTDCVLWEASSGAREGQSNPPAGTEDGGYKNLLNYGWWASTNPNPKPRKIQLNNLEDGKRYLVQIIAYRNSTETLSAAVTAPDGGTTVKFVGDGWTYGSSLSAEFTAETATEEFTLSYSNHCVINAIQVRELPADAPAKKGVVVITY